MFLIVTIYLRKSLACVRLRSLLRLRPLLYVPGAIPMVLLQLFHFDIQMDSKAESSIRAMGLPCLEKKDEDEQYSHRVDKEMPSEPF